MTDIILGIIIGLAIGLVLHLKGTRSLKTKLAGLYTLTGDTCMKMSAVLLENIELEKERNKLKALIENGNDWYRAALVWYADPRQWEGSKFTAGLLGPGPETAAGALGWVICTDVSCGSMHPPDSKCYMCEE